MSHALHSLAPLLLKGCIPITNFKQNGCPQDSHRLQGAEVFHLMPLNTLRPRQNGHHFADDTFKYIFLKIFIKISLKCVPKSPIDNIPALFQIMAWRQPGDKPLSEAMMVSLLTHLCVARPQWVNGLIGPLLLNPKHHWNSFKLAAWLQMKNKFPITIV